MPTRASSRRRHQWSNRQGLFDDPASLDENPAGSVRFHQAGSAEASDSITRWHGHRVLQSGSMARAAWDRESASITSSSQAGGSDQGQAGNALASTLEDYRYASPTETAGADGFAGGARVHMQALDQRTRFFEGGRHGARVQRRHQL